MTLTRRGSAVVELPNDLEILVTRDFEAPIALVFDVLTKPEHISKWFSPFGEDTKECSIDLRVGGTYHIVFAAEDGTAMSFRGDFLEIEPPTSVVTTWRFEGRPEIEAVEKVKLREADGVTTMTITLAFETKADRDANIQGGFDGMKSSYDRVDDVLAALLDQA